jgi:hypothetical protein
VSGAVDVECADAIASKLTPTEDAVFERTASIEYAGTAHAVSGPEQAQDSITGV